MSYMPTYNARRLADKNKFKKVFIKCDMRYCKTNSELLVENPET